MNRPIKVGIGGWTFEPWRGPFYPADLPKARELEFATRAVSAIEINATARRLFKPESFAKWAKAAPDGFTFCIKGSQYVCGRKVLAEAGEAIARFTAQGLVELGDRLGPIVWVFLPAKRFDPDDFAAFLKLLPAREAGVPLRHAVEVRHESFVDPAFVAMARAAGVAIVYSHREGVAEIDERTASFSYARLRDTVEAEPAGYDAAALDRWAEKARGWSQGEPAPREVFLFFINGAKVRNPAAAQALMARLAAD